MFKEKVRKIDKWLLQPLDLSKAGDKVLFAIFYLSIILFGGTLGALIRAIFDVEHYAPFLIFYFISVFSLVFLIYSLFTVYQILKKFKEKRKCVKNWKKHGFATCVKRSLENLKLSKTVTISLFVQDAESM